MYGQKIQGKISEREIYKVHHPLLDLAFQSKQVSCVMI